jgi:hypothetical protein
MIHFVVKWNEKIDQNQLPALLTSVPPLKASLDTRIF